MSPSFGTWSGFSPDVNKRERSKEQPKSHNVFYFHIKVWARQSRTNRFTRVFRDLGYFQLTSLTSLESSSCVYGPRWQISHVIYSSRTNQEISKGAEGTFCISLMEYF